jgi:hypothetical protein
MRNNFEKDQYFANVFSRTISNYTAFKLFYISGNLIPCLVPALVTMVDVGLMLRKEIPQIKKELLNSTPTA